MDHAAISRHIRDLELSLGITLRDKTTGGLTQAGQTYYDRIAPLLDGLATATADMRNRVAPLTVTCVHGFAYHWLLPRLYAFRKLHPHMEVQLRSVDASAAFHISGVESTNHAQIGYVRDGSTTPEPRTIRHMAIARPPVFPVASPSAFRPLAASPTQPKTCWTPPCCMRRTIRNGGAGLQRKGFRPPPFPPQAGYGRPILRWPPPARGRV